MKSILITNAYSYKNKGDAGIILSMIDLLKEKYPDAHIQIMSRNYNENKEYYDEIYDNVTSIKPIWYINNKHNHNKILQLFFAVISLLKCMLIMLFYLLLKDKLKTVNFIKKNESIMAYLDANMVCSCGGGYLFSTNKWPISIGLYQHLFHIYLGKFFNKKVIMFPQSIGPINKKIDKILTSKLLKKVDMIYPREEFSYQFLIESGFSSERVNKLPDVAFTMGIEKYPLKDIEGLKIGITVLDWHWAYSDVEEGKKKVDGYINSTANALRILMEKYKAKVYIVPQVVVGKEDSDMAVSKQLFNKLDDPDNTVLIEEDLSAKQLKYLYGNFDLFIGSRMHSCIFAIGAGVPTIGLAYQPKTVGTFELIGLKQRTFNVDNFSTEELVEMCELILTNLETENQLNRQVADATDKNIRTCLNEYFNQNIS
ncbi:hypothetical protein BAQ48_14210 [Bacillus luti]|uniref:polysaccharide pyruvyl transferase family protein n=1 Tax=Bacillus luti TaxID=2026191 RepID=UPI0008FE966D|nr:hypothetical protein BAQ48_14210 [Bacillus luti]